MHIDLNCDLGEGAPHDEELMALITSANIACGGHAGDADTMQRTVGLAKKHGVAIGAHPGYRDRANFGRIESDLSAAEIGELVTTQTGLLRRLAGEQDLLLHHVKPHGAFYNQAARDPGVANVIAETLKKIDGSLILYGLAGSELITSGKARGLSTASEVFADRRYRADGSLVPRSEAHAMITDPTESCEQVLRFIRDGKADTVCIHGDGPHAVTFAIELRRALDAAGITVKVFSA